MTATMAMPTMRWCFWLLSACLLWTVRADIEVPLGIPNPTSLQNHKTFYEGSGYKHAFHWSIENAGTPNQTLHGILELNGNNMKWAWIGLGWGRTMLDAQFIVCHQLAGQSIEMHEHESTGAYKPPQYHYYGAQVTIPIRGAFNNNTLLCEFNRKTDPNDGIHINLNLNSFTDVIWAFNPNSAKNYEEKWFSYHEKDHRGAAQADLVGGSIVSIPAKSIERKQLHGFGMMAVWLGLFPFSVYYARYLRSTVGWLFVHLTLQVLGIIGIIAFFVIILTEYIALSRPHAILGLILISFIAVQLVLGICNILGLSNESLSRVRKWVRRSHNLLGAALILTAVAQVALGLETLFPWVEPRGKGAWAVFFALVAFWVTAFIGTEAFFWISVRRTDIGMPQKQMVQKSDKPFATKVERGGTSVTLTETTVPLDHTQIRPDMPRFTWATLNQAVMNGELLVVANGRYVYSIAQWMTSHPGGQLILHAVNGTDITNDYFHEAGFDAEEFVPKPEAPAQRAERTQATLHRQAASIASSEVTAGYRQSSIVQEMKLSPLMAERDWRLVVRSRRTHVHTRLAIQKLSKMLVGELVPDLDQPYANIDADAASTGRTFDPNEYRRYALVENSPITQGASIYKFRFCLLYPYDVRDGEPLGFLPGQAIEIQARINGRLITRFYSPQTDGNLSVFEIDVKIYPHGTMTQYLVKQKPGDRQFKIRGPFGTPLVNPERPLHLGSSDWVPRRLIFIAGGTGITPFLQLIKYLLLPVLEPLRVTTDYAATLEDELTLTRGDRVLVKHHYFDGWAIGVNVRTGMEGAFPLTVTSPRCSSHVSITLIHGVQTASETILGNEFIEGALLAYADCIQVHRFIADGTLPADGAATGIIYPARLGAPDLESILRQRWPLDDEQEEVERKRMFVCGPTGFDSWVVDVVSEIGVDTRCLTVLPSDRVI
ncbi:uncharacterized protein SPPG_02277 [Spizellomyces punctatus DAOM BR117]|uniref:Cytochrome b5 heme-binding domain-containing protein n=1 Tax=Spizellomyces punctatus (strain DAOM BR117) TaxID=645134 RepID=A0A0L0HQ41_SPIPD|nr:uncharacterized protein SPPG_02277 [Spizellomyces punctatus DAOM BR117]KND03222.1 hypothetical protein SPPG_02277 [Spizellomyces punctatus DAOM BR117]|eukprot:XP_016611261.1 hypothetical protein SPPG_02277 [Spizellomyces punctatus DAOM BR117]